MKECGRPDCSNLGDIRSRLHLSVGKKEMLPLTPNRGFYMVAERVNDLGEGDIERRKKMMSSTGEI